MENMNAQPFNFNWGTESMGDAFATPQTTTTSRQDISEFLYIKGYIAGRKNTLTESFNVEAATEQYRAAFDAKANGNKSITVDGKEIKRSFSQKNFVLLLGQGALDELKNQNFYKLNVKEAQPEFLVCESTIFGEMDGTEMANLIRKGYTATDRDNKTLIIRPKSLSEILYNLGAKGIIYIKVKEDGALKDVGVFSPQKLKSTDKNGKNKIALRYFPLYDNGTFGTFVQQLGVIKGIPYAVNKKFEGEPVEGEVKLSNEKQIRERYPELLDKLHEIGETLPREVTKGTDQNIPYEVYADVYEALGVTEVMLSKVRSKKSSGGSKTLSLMDITAGFQGLN